MPEILAPAGGPEQLTAAVRSGADAVYLGLQSMNARRSAHNFSEEELRDAVRYCHAYGVRVYVTLNTLLADTEIGLLREALGTVCACGADAVIVQDMAVAAAVKKACPGLALHASTQMSVHNVEGAKELEQFGFRRIVLARELNLSEITQITQSVECETEVFVHGAHCMSVSGQCYLSAMIGARSGNRGMCAQPCRLNFVNPHGRECALSLKDMCAVPALPALEKAGVASFKIEGRMKRPEYVAAAVDACRKKLAGETPDLDRLRQVFSRSGFTDGYLTDRRTPAMFGIRTKDDVSASAAVLSSISELYRGERQKIPVSLTFRMQKDVPCRLTLSDGVHTVTAEGEPPQTAQSRPADEGYVLRSLTKLGGTPFFADKTACEIGEGLMSPASALNALRRDAAGKLYECRAGIRPVACDAQQIRLPAVRTERTVHDLRLRFQTAEQVSDIPDNADVILPTAEIMRHPDLLAGFGDRLIAEIPALLWGEDGKHQTDHLLRLREQGLCHALCGNIGAVRIAREAGLTVHGDTGLNIFNSSALLQYEKIGVSDAVVSFELTAGQIQKLDPCIPVGMLAYGYLPLMRLRACPMKGINGCGSCDGKQCLTDRTGMQFRVLCSDKKYQTMLNCVPLFIGKPRLPRVDFAQLYFTTETAEQCRTICEMFLHDTSPTFKRTAGLYARGVL